MAYSRNTYVADGTTDTFSLSFTYLSPAYVYVTVDGVAVAQGDVAWLTSASIKLPSTPASGKVVRIYRQTPKSSPLVVFADGPLGARSLNRAFTALLHIVQEQVDDTDEVKAVGDNVLTYLDEMANYYNQCVSLAAAALGYKNSAATSATNAQNSADAAAATAASMTPAQYLTKADNLASVASKPTARTNLGLATVAATGDYNDLTNKPVSTLPNDIAILAMQMADLQNSTILAAGWWAESFDTLTTYNSAGSSGVDTSEAGALKPTTVESSHIPVLTSNTGVGVTVSASSEAVNVAWAAADDDSTDTYWHTGPTGSPWWWQATFSAAKKVTSYRLRWRTSGASAYPTAWTLAGSNDGSSWTTIDTRTGQSPVLTAGGTKYTLAAPASYTYYRITFTASDNAYASMRNIALINDVVQNADIRFVPQDIGSVPTTLDIYMAVQQVDALTWGTDFVVYGTRNNAAAWTQSGAISVIGTVAGITLIKTTVTVSGQSSGQLVAPRVVSANNKSFKLHGLQVVGRT